MESWIPSTVICRLLRISLWTLPPHLICTSNTLPSPASKDTWKGAVADTTTDIPGVDMLWELSFRFKKKQIKALKYICTTGNRDFFQSMWCAESCMVTEHWICTKSVQELNLLLSSTCISLETWKYLPFYLISLFHELL